MVIWTILASPFFLPYDDEITTDENIENNDAASENNEEIVDKKKPVKIKLDQSTQEYVNSLLAEERRKGVSKNTELITQLRTQQNKAGTSEAERSRLETRIEELTSEYQTKEQLAKQTSSKKIKTLELERDTAMQRADKWQKLFQSDRVTNSLLQAATDAKAYNPSQVVALLTPNTRLVDLTDESGNAIPDSWVEKVKINARDKDGKAITLDLTAKEAVKQLAEMPEFGNLFISSATSGIGGGNIGSNGVNSDTPPADTESYLRWRTERKKKGLSL